MTLTLPKDDHPSPLDLKSVVNAIPFKKSEISWSADYDKGNRWYQIQFELLQPRENGDANLVWFAANCARGSAIDHIFLQIAHDFGPSTEESRRLRIDKHLLQSYIKRAVDETEKHSTKTLLKILEWMDAIGIKDSHNVILRYYPEDIVVKKIQVEVHTWPGVRVFIEMVVSEVDPIVAIAMGVAGSAGTKANEFREKIQEAIANTENGVKSKAKQY